jgi:hypothetical protein
LHEKPKGVPARDLLSESSLLTISQRVEQLFMKIHPVELSNPEPFPDLMGDANA